ncbi:ABC transporter substrate-binding protein [Granulosicoccus antarcticus]|uniref:ABC transporter substrate-binding protein n=1 Tax=Granulosicoccus antarcticus TaxID=437505 RepID=UPI001F281D1E|nr:ABC transporter substrate-binding protein [Granulosicoccus antarcticus]
MAAVLLTAAGSPAFAKCGNVTITEMNWSSAAVVTSISKFLMEQGYNCTVTTVPSGTVTAITSVAETGEPDIVTELWLSGVPAYAELEAAGKIRTLTHVLSEGGVDAWWVPQYLIDDHPELATMEGILANPGLVGDRFHNCPDGWGCKVTNEHLAQAYDLAGAGLEVFDHGSGETLAAAIAAAYESKEPWFGYYWAPTSVLGKYPMVKIDLGTFDKAIHDCNAAEECATPGKSSYPPAEVITAVTTDFESRQPEIAELMSHVSFTNEQMSKILAWQEDNNASSEETAVHFLTNYPDVWSTWLSEVARERLSALLQ